ncbi:DNA-binding MarR family transcriptional regulator [Jatrophihabitans sp. GAS493]|uniref:MarR family winged helix-turn-helix transcriptional regulator n=1 Tax=Jatrophihabitans sp. GAS493 TaxID=1907575 RepID=UPI000BB8FE86|nr:MarR family transcriptional regulator [Jatrophihabitans sp. GAS493]SOD72561.1 DNA-binding MarR family transcriptional regulator [Jatrophihabitans sp. GAS493]
MPNRLEQKPTWLISQLYLRAHRLLADGFADAGSRGYHYRLLAALEEQGPTSQAELGRATGMDRSDVVAALNELADGGYVRRSPDAEDRRRNVITMTRRGIRRLADLEPVVAAAQVSLLAALSRTEQAQLLALMRKVVDAAPEA